MLQASAWKIGDVRVTGNPFNPHDCMVNLRTLMKQLDDTHQRLRVTQGLNARIPARLIINEENDTTIMQDRKQFSLSTLQKRLLRQSTAIPTAARNRPKGKTASHEIPGKFVIRMMYHQDTESTRTSRHRNLLISFG